MSSTNHTTNYNLPQFIGTDKPAWLGDVNPALAAIDAQMKLNADAASAASGAAATADGKAVSAGNAAATADGKAEAAQTTANGAVTAINTLAAKLTLSDNQSMNCSEFSFAISSDSGTLYLSQSDDGSIFKLYGNILFDNPQGSNRSVSLVAIPKGESDTQVYGIKTTLQLATAPAGSYVVAGAILRNTSTRGGNDRPVYNMWNTAFAVGADGYIYLNISDSSTTTMVVPANGILRFCSFPCVYFNENFGDSPEE